ncbi:hypothetical protein FF011L_12230 [Roseimaritima multifibrata]|uniref:Uncharacterized protein n=2 Tax=Roseimaritima multifibrata TaxID=1930274 RepID=A0A517MC56_9BACT|nr:hypothetical protein FF011L_12230 [Roseimaritima multifibrata]
MMTNEARLAFEKLVELGAEPLDWDIYNPSVEPHIAFGLSAQVTRLGKSLFVDPGGQDIIETMVDGEWHNPGGVRQDVHEILRQHHLVSDWYNSVVLCVYNDPSAPGYDHDRKMTVT